MKYRADWLDTQFINIDARMAEPPSGPDTIKQFHLMMRRILAEQFDRFIGHYDFPQDRILTVYRESEKFFTQVTGQRPVEIRAESEHKFFAPMVGAEYRFIFDSQDRVAEVELRQSGHNITAKFLDERTAQQRAEKMVSEILRQMAAPGRSAADSGSGARDEMPAPIEPA